MRILWLSHLIPYPPKGGVLQRSHNLVKELARYHEVDLLAFNQRSLIGPLFKSVTLGVEEARLALNSICRRFAIFDIESDRVPWGPYALAIRSLVSGPYNINWLKSNAFASMMREWIEQEKYDLIHFDTISLVPFFHLVPVSTATSLDHHNIESYMLMRRAKNERNLLKRVYFWQEGMRLARYERQFCPRFSLNITCSDVDTQRLLQIAPQAVVRTIPNGVDLDFFRPQGLAAQSNRLIFVGTMNWYPNVDAVMYIAEKLWPRLKKIHPLLVCDIVGANPPASIRALANRLPDFHVHGFVDDVRPFIERATVYVCPIRDGGGTKLKILDAMAMEKAIVAHPIACEGIHVTHGQDVLLAESDEAFIDCISHLLGASEKRKSFGIAARRLMDESYGYRAIGKELSEIFQNYLR